MKRLFSVLFVVISVFALSLCAYASGLLVQANEDIVIAPNEENAFFLPAFVSPRNIKFSVVGESLEYVDEKGEKQLINKEKGYDLNPFKKATDNGAVYYEIKTIENSKEIKYKLYFANNLSSIFVTTSRGHNTLVSQNGEDTSSKILILNSDGTYEYKDSSYRSEIKVRGNTTKDYLKKPFQIKLDTKTDLFDLGEGKSWILLANYLDHSLLRNSVMLQIAKLLGMDAPDFKSVDLYLDGQYYGIYLLCEKIQINENRLNIYELEKENDLLNPTYNQSIERVTTGTLIDETILTEYTYVPNVVNPSDITGGYLIELDNNYYRGEKCYFKTTNNAYVIKSPENASQKEVEYIARLFAEMEEAIMSNTGLNRLGKAYTDYIDLDSFVYAYIVAELGRNYDAGSSSMYFYKDRDVGGVTSKIVKGPLWDCDNTLGNFNKNNASDQTGFWAKDRSIWKGLNEKKKFKDRVRVVFAEVYDKIFDMIDDGGYIPRQVKEIGTSIYMERLAWKSDSYETWPMYYGNGVHYDKWQGQWAPCFNFYEIYSDGIDESKTTTIGYLCECIEERVNWLATEWESDVELRERKIAEKSSPSPSNTDNSQYIVAIVILASLLVVSTSALVVVLIKKKP